MSDQDVLNYSFVKKPARVNNFKKQPTLPVTFVGKLINIETEANNRLVFVINRMTYDKIKPIMHHVGDNSHCIKEDNGTYNALIAVGRLNNKFDFINSDKITDYVGRMVRVDSKFSRYAMKDDDGQPITGVFLSIVELNYHHQTTIPSPILGSYSLFAAEKAMSDEDDDSDDELPETTPPPSRAATPDPSVTIQNNKTRKSSTRLVK